MHALRSAAHGRAGVVSHAGFNIQVGEPIDAEDRDRLETLARYAVRPPVCGERLKLLGNGNVLYSLKRVWSDGTVAVEMTPLELLAKLAPLIPRPWHNQVRYHDVFAPNARLRSAVVPGRTDQPRTDNGDEKAPAPPPSPYVSWADLLRRVFAVDVFECPKCDGGRMRIVACIMKTDAILAILEACRLSTAPPERDPARQLELCGDAVG